MIAHLKHWYNRQHQIYQISITLLLVFLIRTVVFGLYQVPTPSMETTMLVGERFVADKFSVWFMPIKRGDIISFNDPNFNYSDNALVNWWQRYVWGPSNWTKRVIGIPGDHIEGKIEDGRPVIYRNGEKLNEPYLNKYPIVALWASEPHLYNGYWIGDRPTYRSYDPTKPYDQQPFYRIDPFYIININHPQVPRLFEPQTPYPGNIDTFDITLGENEYWAMGDNRLGSYDSRGWGKLDGKLIHGKILFRILSIDVPTRVWSWSDIIFHPTTTWTDWMLIDLVLHPIEFWKRVRWSRCMQFVS